MAKQTIKSPPSLDELMGRADEFARREPSKAVVAAFGAGFLLNLLPLAGIASVFVGIAFSLVRPALLFLGLLKACELYRNQTAPRHE